MSENTKRSLLSKISDSRREFMKGLATVAAATPVVGSMFKSEDAVADSHGAPKTMYLKGKYFESCTCDTICPCLLLLDPTTGYCTAMLGWSIEKGHVGDVDVGGLKVGMFLHAPGNLLKGGFKVALYIDDNASNAQHQALKEAYHGIHGGHADEAGICAMRNEGDGTKTTRGRGLLPSDNI